MPKEIKAPAKTTIKAPSKARAGIKPTPPPSVMEAPFNFAATHSFVYLAHPTRWDVYETSEGPELLPQLRAFPRAPGVNGVVYVRGHDDGDETAAVANLCHKDGWVKVDPNVTVLAFGESVDGYVHQYPGRSGPINLPVWTRLYQLGDEVQRQFDADGFHDFLRFVRDNYLGQPTPEIKRSKHLQLRNMAAKGLSKQASPAGAIAGEIMARKAEAVAT